MAIFYILLGGLCNDGVKMHVISSPGPFKKRVCPIRLLSNIRCIVS